MVFFFLSFSFFSLNECVGGSNKYLSRRMSKVKSNDNDFLHDNNKADGKKKKSVYGARNTQVLNAKPDLFVSTTAQQRAVSQSDKKFSYIEILLAMRQHGCVCACVRVVKQLEMW